MDYTMAELMATVLSREIRDGEVVAVGTLSPIPAAALWLAQETHAPSAQDLVLGNDWPFDSTKEFYDFVQRGELDVFFLSGAQIDRRGNINLHVIGDYDSPRVRLPGGAGSAMLYFMAGRTLLFKTNHDSRSFIEAVDFVTSVGVSDPGVYRPGRLGGVFTPLCVMRHDENGFLQLDSLMPGVTVEQVRQNTGFDLGHRDDVPEIKPPDREILQLLRGKVRERLQSLYPRFVQEEMLPA